MDRPSRYQTVTLRFTKKFPRLPFDVGGQQYNRGINKTKGKE